MNKAPNTVFMFATIVGVTVSIIAVNVAEAFEGVPAKEHPHSEYHYSYLGNQNMMSVGTTASTVALNGSSRYRDAFSASDL